MKIVPRKILAGESSGGPVFRLFFRRFSFRNFPFCGDVVRMVGFPEAVRRRLSLSGIFVTCRVLASGLKVLYLL